MKLISWNVNGLRACVQKGFLDYFKETDADFFCIQESKLQEGQIDLDLPGYHQYWNYAQKKGYSGTAVLPEKNHFTSPTDLESKNTIKKDASSHWNMRVFISLPAIRQTHRMNLQDFHIVCSGRMTFLPI